MGLDKSKIFPLVSNFKKEDYSSFACTQSHLGFIWKVHQTCQLSAETKYIFIVSLEPR